jgi:DNA-directed RNA polymerase specialized sigma24 family protein
LEAPAAFVRRARRGDAGVDALITAAWPYACRLCARILGRSDLALHAAQKPYAQVVAHLHHLRDPEAFVPWLYRIAIGAAYGQRRRQRRQRTCMLEDGEDLVASPGGDGLEAVESHLDLVKAMGGLPESLRTPVLLT